MGLMVDTSVLVADERGRFDMPAFLGQTKALAPIIAAITASELLHGVERADTPTRKARRQQYVDDILNFYSLQPFAIAEARIHARLWADLETRGLAVGAHDLIIAASAVTHDHELATINVREFLRIPGLRVQDATVFLLS